MDREAWEAIFHKVVKSQTWLSNYPSEVIVSFLQVSTHSSTQNVQEWYAEVAKSQLEMYGIRGVHKRFRRTKSINGGKMTKINGSRGQNLTVASAVWLFGGDFDFMHLDRAAALVICVVLMEQLGNSGLPALLAFGSPDKQKLGQKLESEKGRTRGWIHSTYKFSHLIPLKLLRETGAL